MSWFMFFIDHYPSLFYLAIFVAMFVEGDITLLVLGGLSKGQYANFFAMFVVAFVATLVHDTIFWRLGKYLAKYNKKKYLFFDLGKFSHSLERFLPYVGPIIFLSKFIWNFNRIILVSAGYMKVPFKKMFKYSLGAAIAWPLAYMSIGYVFADQTAIFRQRLEIAAAAILGLIILMALFEMYVRKFIFKNFFSNGNSNGNKDEEKK